MHVRGNLNTLYDGPFRDTQPYQVLYVQDVLTMAYSEFTMKFWQEFLDTQHGY